jgi:hypothetical protein
MSDLVSGHYPGTYEEWMLDGQPSQPFRQNFSRRYPFVAAGLAATAGTAWVVPVVCHQGDVISNITIGVKTATNSGTIHGWAALYTGVTTAATLIAQSADDTSGFHGSGAAQTFTITSHLIGTDPGSTGTNGPTVLGVMLYNEGTTGGVLDAISVGSEAVAGSVFVTGQLPLLFTRSGQSYGATAPSSLASFAAAAAAFVTPLVILH